MFKPVIKWSGSKRSQATFIKSFFPKNFNNYYEPFLGGGSILYVVNDNETREKICGDICQPLIDLWIAIRDNPRLVAKNYQKRWDEMQKKGYQVYYKIRDNFNKYKSSDDLLFLSRTCVNGLIRFNESGEFNNSLHYSRSGINPTRLEDILLDWSAHIQKVDFVSADYISTTAAAKKGDLIYLDPPYFHTKGRYFGTIDFKRFVAYLEDLNKREIKYMLSFDGKRGKENYVVDLPRSLYKRHVLLPSGNSAFKKVIDKKREEVWESLYLNF